jgi:CHAD domain-containing protein
MNDADSSGFLLPHNFDATRVVDKLGGDEHCELGETIAFSLCYYDSFDWRLHAAGLRLLQVASPHGTVLRLRSAQGEGRAEPVGFDATPAWPGDLPEGDLRSRVSDMLAMRVLLPVARVSGTAIGLRALNHDGKTVVRMQLLTLQSEPPDSNAPRALWPRLQLMPVRGYDNELSALEDYLARDIEWPRAPACLFEESITAIGRVAGDYSSKLDVPLQRGQPALEALRTILLTLLDTIERNVQGTRANLDSEFLHDLRVATRRTRSALSQVKRVLPQPVIEEFKQRFAWLGQITGPTRDLDVFLLELPHYRAILPAAMAGDLDALEEHLRAAHVTEQARLKRKLGSPEFKALLRDWRSLLEGEVLPDEPGWFADLPAERVASQRIWRMYKKVLSVGRTVKPDGPPEEMHELRKDCKKLRYLIEFFRNLYPEKPLKGIIRTLKDLLDDLGEYQDKEVQAERLRTFAAEFDREDPQSLRSVMAVGALVADLLRHQQQAHERFAGCFARFDSAENRQLYKQLFKRRGD